MNLQCASHVCAMLRQTLLENSAGVHCEWPLYDAQIQLAVKHGRGEVGMSADRTNI